MFEEKFQLLLEKSVSWAGHYIEKGFSVQGNMLVGEEVIKQMVLAWTSVNKMNLIFPGKLLTVLESGEAI